MKNLASYLVLLALTTLACELPSIFPASTRLPMLIMFLAAAKFLIVGFRFMDLRRAHRAWQAAYLGFTALFLTFFHFAT